MLFSLKTLLLLLVVFFACLLISCIMRTRNTTICTTNGCSGKSGVFFACALFLDVGGAILLSLFAVWPLSLVRQYYSAEKYNNGCKSTLM